MKGERAVVVAFWVPLIATYTILVGMRLAGPWEAWGAGMAAGALAAIIAATVVVLRIMREMERADRLARWNGWHVERTHDSVVYKRRPR